MAKLLHWAMAADMEQFFPPFPASVIINNQAVHRREVVGHAYHPGRVITSTMAHSVCTCRVCRLISTPFLATPDRA
jgi:hypothetical protein